MFQYRYLILFERLWFNLTQYFITIGSAFNNFASCCVVVWIRMLSASGSLPLSNASCRCALMILSRNSTYRYSILAPIWSDSKARLGFSLSICPPKLMAAIWRWFWSILPLVDSSICWLSTVTSRWSLLPWARVCCHCGVTNSKFWLIRWRHSSRRRALRLIYTHGLLVEYWWI